MKNTSIIIKNGLIVTGGSLVSLAVAYGIYVFLFLTVREMAIQAGTFDLISKVRIIYGISAILICALIYRTRLIDWIKASVLAGALATMMISIGVQMYEFKPFFFRNHDFSCWVIGISDPQDGFALVSLLCHFDFHPRHIVLFIETAIIWFPELAMILRV